ncbi:MAG TPA: sigma-70 family RNA polymerase sigma factor [Planctomycetota bacterium]|nr:sigma-70 family RNA polymerase sigma factor [Planctomycetota bacterium]
MSPPEVPGDRDLIERARRGDRDAFGMLVVRHQDRIYTAVLRFCGDAEDARDIVQRAFVNAWRRLDAFKGDSAFSTWMYRIAFNESVSFRREGGRRRLVSIHGRDGESAPEPADDRGPGDRLESEENRRKVQEALNLLDPDERKILILKELDDRSYDEIAEILEIPKGTVRSRLFRARESLREKLRIVLKTTEPGSVELRPRGGGT